MSRQFSVSIPADAGFLKAVRAFFKASLGEFLGDETDMVVLALDESLSNVLKHHPAGGRGGVLCVKAELLDDRIRFRLDDYCRSEDVPRIRPRDLEEVRPGGLGTHFVRRIMDRMEFEADPECPGRMSLVLEKCLPE